MFLNQDVFMCHGFSVDGDSLLLQNVRRKAQNGNDRSCDGVLRFVMGNGAKGCEVKTQQLSYWQKIVPLIASTLIDLIPWYWALALPCYAIVTNATIFVFYIGLNFMATPPPTSLKSIFEPDTVSW
ncbi:hypothetical protein CTI12_AA601290 [Artemisia annua]|uniref:Uncharacterized protein n=1 Tax=Artemisia annua TaxID=35608 RepID=A0A2U1KI06_ARTAN|nr:hypothetical protein CTI12_AA601290 [Artemisia annua]